jgi:signal transduction histidine kinase
MLLIGIAKYSSLLPSTDYRWNTTISSRSKQSSLKKEPLEKRKSHEWRKHTSYFKKDNLQMYIIFLAGLASIIAYSSLFVVYPASFLDEYSLHRPYEIPPLILFSITLFLFYKKKLYLKKDVVYKGILIYLIVDIFSQVIMSYSTAPFDTAHNVAHVLKDVGYFVNIIALALSGLQYTVALRERNEVIQSQYETIKESEKIKDEFINIAAHELRTPIQPILALSIFLANKKGAIEEYKDHIDVIIKSSKRLQKLAEEILDVSKIESHSLHLDIERFDLLEVITNLIREYNHGNGENTIDIKFLFEGKEIIITGSSNEDRKDQTMFVYADKNRITRTLSNLLSNALKFTKNGKIDVTVQKNSDDDYLSIKIRDYGPGIDEAILPRLFGKFITGTSSGTGLGLYISKNIVEAHLGKLRAENNYEDDRKGATFTFTLPIK